MEEAGEDATWRNQQLSDIEKQWAEDQRQLRSHLLCTDMLDFDWVDPHVSHELVQAQREEAKTDSEEVADGTAVVNSSSQRKPPLALVGGVDISFVGESSSEACAALIVCEYPSMKVVYEDYEMVHMNAPYIAGFLAFREVEHLLRLLERLKSDAPDLSPQIILVDGNGVLHHRGFGLASHFGVLADIPTIGVGKNLLLVDGLDRSEVANRANEELKAGGEAFDLIGESGNIWGSCLRSTDASTNPIYVSIGHRISLATATSVVHSCCHNRIPEPVRQADLRSREFIRKYKASQPSATAAIAADSAEGSDSATAATASAAVQPPSEPIASSPARVTESKRDEESPDAAVAQTPRAPSTSSVQTQSFSLPQSSSISPAQRSRNMKKDLPESKQQTATSSSFSSVASSSSSSSKTPSKSSPISAKRTISANSEKRQSSRSTLSSSGDDPIAGTSAPPADSNSKWTKQGSYAPKGEKVPACVIS